MGGISIPAGVNPLALQAQLAILAARGAPGAAAALAGLKRAQPEGGFGLPNVVPAPAAPRVPQQDGAGDDGEDEEEGGDADDGEKADGAGQEEAADDEVLSSDSEEEDDEEEDVQDFLCCQFEKVARTKNRWKISMREGVFHINGVSMHDACPCMLCVHVHARDLEVSKGGREGGLQECCSCIYMLAQRAEDPSRFWEGSAACSMDGLAWIIPFLQF